MAIPIIKKLQRTLTDAGGRLKKHFSQALLGFNRLSRREKRVCILTLTTILIFIFDVGVFRPLRHNLSTLEEKIKSQEKEMAGNMRGLSQKTAVNDAYQQVLQNLDSQLKSAEEIRATFLKDIESLARENNVTLAEVRPQVSVEKESHTLYSVRVQAEGRLQEVINFLSALVKTRKLYILESIRATPHSEDINKIKVTASLLRFVFRDL